ncbi:MAG: HD domain-containing protein, partial [Elusimicrobiota bacterium]
AGLSFDAVNLISDPIHGYVELTKRLSRAESGALGLPDEDAAEDDLIDTAWVQRLRRISQLQSARWVFPTAEHSRFTHGLGVMHEAGLWARALYPSLRGALRAVDGPASAVPSEGLVVETLRVAGLLHDVGHGPFAHYFDEHVLHAFEAPPDPRRPAGKRLSQNFGQGDCCLSDRDRAGDIEPIRVAFRLDGEGERPVGRDRLPAVRNDFRRVVGRCEQITSENRFRVLIVQALNSRTRQGKEQFDGVFPGLQAIAQGRVRKIPPIAQRPLRRRFLHRGFCFFVVLLELLQENFAAFW